MIKNKTKMPECAILKLFLNKSFNSYCAHLHGREVCRARVGGTCPPVFFEANVKSLILTIGAPQIYIIIISVPPVFKCALPVFIVTSRPCSPPVMTVMISLIKFQLNCKFAKSTIRANKSES